MPTQDLTAILNNPRYRDDSLVCTRNVQSVSTRGLAANVPTDIPFSGVVFPESGDILERLAAGSYIKGTIRIISDFLLRDGTRETEDADVVAWQGKHYTVTDVQDYSNYGSGFVSARCELIALNG